MALDKLSSISVIGTRQYYSTHKRLDAYFVHPEKIDAYLYIKNVAENKGYKIADLESLLIMRPESGRSAKEQSGSVIVIKPGLLSSDFLINIDNTAWTTDDDFNASEKGQLKNGDILILSAAHAAGYIGKNTSIFLTSDDNKAICIGELIRLRPDDKRINPYYLLAYLNNPKVRLFFQYSVRGQTVHLYPNDIRKIPVILPPRKIQDSIGNKLKHSIEAKLEARKKKKEIDEIFAKYLPMDFEVMHNLSQRLSCIYKKSDVFFYNRSNPYYFQTKFRYLESKLSQYKLCPLNKISEKIISGATPPAGLKPFTNIKTNHPFIRNGDIKEGILNYKTNRWLKPQFFNRYMAISVREGDILISMTGTIGDACVVPSDKDKGIINQNISRIRIKSDLNIPSHYLVEYILYIGKYFMDRLSTGPIQSYLNNEILGKLPVVLLPQNKMKIISLLKENFLVLDKEGDTQHYQAMSELEKLLSIEGGL